MPEQFHRDHTPSFHHERMDVYLTALDFVALTRDVAASMPRRRGGLTDQLERASISVVLNIAEGSGEFSRKEKVRFYRMALRSATECAATLDIGVRLGIMSNGHRKVGNQLLNRIAAMLQALIHRHEEASVDGKRI